MKKSVLIKIFFILLCLVLLYFMTYLLNKKMYFLEKYDEKKNDDNLKHKLVVHLDASNKKSYNGTGNMWKDISNYSNNFQASKLKNKWNSDEKFFLTYKTQFYGNTGSKIFDSNPKHFSIIIQSQSIPNLLNVDNIDVNMTETLSIGGNQKYGLIISIPNNYGKISIVVADKLYVIPVHIIPTNNNVYTFTYRYGVISIWLNSVNIYKFKVDNIYFNDEKIVINKKNNWDTRLYSLLIYKRHLEDSEIKKIVYNLKKNIYSKTESDDFDKDQEEEETQEEDQDQEQVQEQILDFNDDDNASQEEYEFQSNPKYDTNKKISRKNNVKNHDDVPGYNNTNYGYDVNEFFENYTNSEEELIDSEFADKSCKECCNGVASTNYDNCQYIDDKGPTSETINCNNYFKKYKKSCKSYEEKIIYDESGTDKSNEISADIDGYPAQHPQDKPSNITDKCPTINLVNGKYILHSSDGSIYHQQMGTDRSLGKNKNAARDIYELNYPDCLLPNILKEDNWNKGKGHCPYLIYKKGECLNPCLQESCQNIDWTQKDLSKINESCKRYIDNYCSDPQNKSDKNCKCWQPKSSDKCKRYVDKFRGCRNRNVCDYSNYVRKDKIPCFNCNLTDGIPIKENMGRSWGK